MQYTFLINYGPFKQGDIVKIFPIFTVNQKGEQSGGGYAILKDNFIYITPISFDGNKFTIALIA